jgi:hypothetical protein
MLKPIEYSVALPSVHRITYKLTVCSTMVHTGTNILKQPNILSNQRSCDFRLDLKVNIHYFPIYVYSRLRGSSFYVKCSVNRNFSTVGLSLMYKMSVTFLKLVYFNNGLDDHVLVCYLRAKTAVTGYCHIKSKAISLRHAGAKGERCISPTRF